MKKYLIILTIPMIIFAKEIKTGFVESSRIFAEYQATAGANSQFNEFVNTCRDSAAKLQQSIETLKSELEAQKLVLSEEARLKKLDGIESLTRAYNQFLQDAFGQNGKVEQKNDELMAPLMKKINEAVSKIALQEGFSIVLDLSEGVFYASSELNLTDLVINELNREYGPQVLPTGVVKKSIGIFPLREENSEAVDAELGQRCQNELYNGVEVYRQRFNIVNKSAINAEIVKRGLGRNIDEEQALNIALVMLGDYIIVGQVTKSATKIEYTIVLKEVRTKQEIASRANSVTEDIKLQESLISDLRAMMEEIK